MCHQYEELLVIWTSADSGAVEALITDLEHFVVTFCLVVAVQGHAVL